MRKIKLFAPGRLCLFGEHSDWAGVNRTMNPDIVAGCAIVTGVQQGIYATAYKSDKFVYRSDFSEDTPSEFVCDMEMYKLRSIAREGGYFSYVAGVASYMSEWYHVGGITIEVNQMDLPMKSGLSSSAAICVLVTQAFNQLYNLNLNTLGVMNIAYWGELRTPSKCGRLDQACAFGVTPVSMMFDGNEIDVEPIDIGGPLYYVFANLMGEKDTVKILSDLSKAYPFADNELKRRVQEALGIDNLNITNRAKLYIEKGDAKSLGLLMNEAQEIFDRKIAPMCPSELCAPILHSTMSDPNVLKYIYGTKGVGSQGDGTIQFLAKDEESQNALIQYLEEVKGMKAYPLTLGVNSEKNAECEIEVGVNTDTKLRKAIIPVAGFGTRLYPETRRIKKEFCPIIAKNGMLKPGIMILLEELDLVGIEEICLVLNREEKEYYYDYFFTPLSDEHLSKLDSEKLEYEKKIKRISQKLRFVYQDEAKGFGHAVFQAKEFAGNDPVLLLLGDTIYDSNSDVPCIKQLMNEYEKVNSVVIGLQKISVEDVASFGIFYGEKVNDDNKRIKITKIFEKPSVEYARENMLMESDLGVDYCYAAFGTYVIDKTIFERLGCLIRENDANTETEIGFTDAMVELIQDCDIYGLMVDGVSYDLGNPEAYRNAVANY